MEMLATCFGICWYDVTDSSSDSSLTYHTKVDWKDQMFFVCPGGKNPKYALALIDIEHFTTNIRQ